MGAHTHTHHSICRFIDLSRSIERNVRSNQTNMASCVRRVGDTALPSHTPTPSVRACKTCPSSAITRWSLRSLPLHKYSCRGPRHFSLINLEESCSTCRKTAGRCCSGVHTDTSVSAAQQLSVWSFFVSVGGKTWKQASMEHMRRVTQFKMLITWVSRDLEA